MASATARTISALPSMPVFTASAPMSPSTASIWARTSAGGSTWTAETATVFCAVIAVTAEAP